MDKKAYRIHLIQLFDPFLAVHTSAIEPLPHQISAVYEEMLPKPPLRFVLADDPGAGKTIMTGLLLKELIICGELKRCMIVSLGMTTKLDNTRVIRNAGNLMDEVINHLMNVEGANTEIKLIVDANLPNGIPVPTVSTVTKNYRILHVDDSGFQD